MNLEALEFVLVLIGVLGFVGGLVRTAYLLTYKLNRILDAVNLHLVVGNGGSTIIDKVRVLEERQMSAASASALDSALGKEHYSDLVRRLERLEEHVDSGRLEP